ncbi:hypothetical protein DPMN_147917 [Dreissena polymorpha]|uniref:Uncharacterized protein n=1 Tax=Dreissena polymorpha TaxID=45954 RepID=A0A9D4FAT7_DREPO|nr:hypothetical protein DPMN_147917 [Dreissena polymorpha]
METAKKRKMNWSANEINAINSQSLTQRSVEEVKKKLSDIKTDVRQQEIKRLKEARATGGGPAIADPKDWQEKLLSALPKVSIKGFPGIDNFKVQTTFNAEDKELSKESPESSISASTSSKRKNADVEKGSAPEKDEERIFAVEEQTLALKEQTLEIMRQQLQVQADIRDELHNINSFFSSLSNVTTLASCNP